MKNTLEMSAYDPQPIDISGIELTSELTDLIEALAQNVHDTWARNRMDQGWTWGVTRDDALKKNPCLVPYEDLPESEKEYDRDTAVATLKVIQKLGFEIKCQN